MDLKIINQAIYDTMRQVAPETYFALVIWGSDDCRASISSNEMNGKKVSQILSDAAAIVANTKPHDHICMDECAGSA